MQRFRRTLFGYSPRAVDRRLSTLEHRLKVAEERQHLADALREILQRHLTQVKAEVATLRAERELVADRLLSADAEAKRIRREALDDAELLRRHWQAQEEEAREALRLLKEQITAAQQTYEALPRPGSAPDADPAAPPSDRHVQRANQGA